MDAKPTYGELEEIVKELKKEASKHRRAQEALRETEEKYRLLFENAGSAITYFDAEGKCVLVNRRGIDNHGGKDITGKSIYDIHPEVADFHMQRFTKIMKEGRGGRFEDAVELPTGKRWFSSDIQPVKDESGNITGVQVISDDITQRRQAEEALRESQGKYRDIFENVSDFLYFHDLEGNLIETNLVWKTEYGFSEGDLANSNIGDLIPERHKDQFEDYLKRIKEQGKDKGLMSVVTKDGRERIVEYRNSLVYDSTGPIGVRGSARDITEAKRAEVQLKKYSGNLEKMVEERTAELEKALQDLQNTQSQLLQSEKMASIGQLAAGVAHEINNPVGFVKSNLGTMNEYLEDLMKLVDRYRILGTTLSKEKDIRENETLQRTLDDIKKQEDEIGLSFILDDYKKVIDESFEGMARVAKIVSDLKDFAHVDKAELEHADLNNGIESTLNIVWNELKYKAQVIKDFGNIPLVECYPQRLNQVFMNIMVNAAQAIEDKGEIRITTRAENGYVEIRISDTGKGIPPDELPKIFDPFFTTKEVGKGTGLGLNMAYNIIQKHKGTIDVESEVGKGTTFIIRIPVETDA